MKTKRILSVILALICLAGFSACTNKSSSEQTSNDNSVDSFIENSKKDNQLNESVTDEPSDNPASVTEQSEDVSSESTSSTESDVSEVSADGSDSPVQDSTVSTPQNKRNQNISFTSPAEHSDIYELISQGTGIVVHERVTGNPEVQSVLESVQNEAVKMNYMKEHGFPYVTFLRLGILSDTMKTMTDEEIKEILQPLLPTDEELSALGKTGSYGGDWGVLERESYSRIYARLYELFPIDDAVVGHGQYAVYGKCFFLDSHDPTKRTKELVLYQDDGGASWRIYIHTYEPGKPYGEWTDEEEWYNYTKVTEEKAPEPQNSSQG